MTGHDKALRIYQFVLIACVAIAVYVVMVEKARGHSASMGWSYDPFCCNGNNHTGDCQEIPARTVQQVDGDYIITLAPGDHLLVTKPHTFTVKASATRKSQDEFYHLCLYPTENDVRCFYIPPQGS